MALSKILMFLGVVVLGVAIFSGVLEVRYHQEKLAKAVPNLIGLATEAGTYESVRGRGVEYKRAGEQWLIKDVDKRLQLAFQYVVLDTERLNEVLAENEDDPTVVLPQAELLIKSIDRIGDLLVDAPAATVASAKTNTQQMLGDARGALSQLQEFEGQDEELGSQFAQVTGVLEWHIGELDRENTDGPSAVAGDRDEKGDNRDDKTEEIPLEF